MVIQTGKPPEVCDTEITLKEKGGSEIKTGDPKLTAIVDDDEDKTLIAENCCARVTEDISKDECAGDDDNEKDCCNMTLTADPKAVSTHEKTTVTAEFDFSDSEKCSTNQTGPLCEVNLRQVELM